MRIAHVSVTTLSVLYKFGGAIQRRVREIANEQARRGHLVTIFSVGEENGTVMLGQVRVVLIHCYLPFPFRHWEFLWRVSHYPEINTFDVIHFHSQPEGAFFSHYLPARKFLSFDYFNFRRVTQESWFFPVYRRFLNSFDLLFPVSEYCLNQAVAFWRVPYEKFRVVYNGVNLEQFYPDPHLQTTMRMRWQIDKKVILYVGRVCYQKGTDVLINAIKILNKSRNDIKLVIAGPIEQFARIQDDMRWGEKIAQAGGLYLGPIHEDDLNAVYNMADIFVMPTREMEMFGMSAVEAQACGKPVIVSDHGGLKEVTPVTCGFRFQTNAPVDLAGKIQELLDHPELYLSFANNAIENARRFSWRNVCDVLEQYYFDSRRECLGDHQ